MTISESRIHERAAQSFTRAMERKGKQTKTVIGKKLGEMTPPLMLPLHLMPTPLMVTPLPLPQVDHDPKDESIGDKLKNTAGSVATAVKDKAEDAVSGVGHAAHKVTDTIADHIPGRHEKKNPPPLEPVRLGPTNPNITKQVMEVKDMPESDSEGPRQIVKLGDNSLIEVRSFGSVDTLPDDIKQGFIHPTIEDLPTTVKILHEVAEQRAQDNKPSVFGWMIGKENKEGDYEGIPETTPRIILEAENDDLHELLETLDADPRLNEIKAHRDGELDSPDDTLSFTTKEHKPSFLFFYNELTGNAAAEQKARRDFSTPGSRQEFEEQEAKANRQDPTEQLRQDVEAMKQKMETNNIAIQDLKTHVKDLDIQLAERDTEIKKLEAQLAEQTRLTEVLKKFHAKPNDLTDEEKKIVNTYLQIPQLPPHTPSPTPVGQLTFAEKIEAEKIKAFEAIKKEQEEKNIKTKGIIRGTVAPLIGSAVGSAGVRTVLTNAGVTAAPIVGGLTAGAISLGRSGWNMRNGETPETRLRDYSNDKGFRKIGRGLERHFLFTISDVLGKSHEIENALSYEKKGKFEFPTWDSTNQQEREKKLKAAKNLLVKMAWFEYIATEAQTNGTFFYEKEVEHIPQRLEAVKKAREAFLNSSYIPKDAQEEITNNLAPALLQHRNDLHKYGIGALAVSSTFKGIIGASAVEGIGEVARVNGWHWPWDTPAPRSAISSPQATKALPTPAPTASPIPPAAPSVPVHETYTFAQQDTHLMEKDLFAQAVDGQVSDIHGAAQAEAFMRSGYTFTIQTDHGTEIVPSQNFDPFNGYHKAAWDKWHDADAHRRNLEIMFAEKKMREINAGKWTPLFPKYFWHRDMLKTDPSTNNAPLNIFNRMTDTEYENDVRIPALRAA